MRRNNKSIINIFQLQNRYGIRVDPIQWFIVLTGRDEGAGMPSVILLVCKCASYTRSKERWHFFFFVRKSFYKSIFFILFSDSLVPIVICLLIERGLSLVSSFIDLFSRQSVFENRKITKKKNKKQIHLLSVYSVAEYYSRRRWYACTCHQYYCIGTDTDGHYSCKWNFIQFE